MVRNYLKGRDGDCANALLAAAGSTGIRAFDRAGNILGTVSNMGLGIEFLGLVTDNGLAQIAGVQLTLTGAEPAGFAIDNLRFGRVGQVVVRSEEHTSELQSLMRISYAVFCLKKKNTKSTSTTPITYRT